LPAGEALAAPGDKNRSSAIQGLIDKYAKQCKVGYGKLHFALATWQAGKATTLYTSLPLFN
jgi:hypothetical protein